MTVIGGIPMRIGWPELYERYLDFPAVSDRWKSGIPRPYRDALVQAHRRFIELLPREALDLYLKMTTWNPARRITARDALEHSYLNNL
jgi:hypothetical protein